MFPRCLCAVLILLCGCAFAAEAPPAFTLTEQSAHPLVGRVWLPPTRSFATPEELTRRAATADMVLLGETHDNADHHRLQSWLTRQVFQSGKRPALAFEMMDSGQSEALESWRTQAPADAAGLAGILSWDKSGWPAWSNYQPLADSALKAQAPILTANLSRQETSLIAKGSTPASLRGQLGLDIPLEPVMRQAMEQDIQNGHCNMLPDRALPAMVRVQRARDAVMARALTEGVAASGSAILIAGSGHARSDRGVPVHLSALAPGRSVLSVAFVEVEAGLTDPAAYGARFEADVPPFDAVWFTPRAPREDPCEAFRRHMEGKKGE